eukprot:scaffold56_cov379-Prasinococcus_capsulatus_cf.AAC.13
MPGSYSSWMTWGPSFGGSLRGTSSIGCTATILCTVRLSSTDLQLDLHAGAHGERAARVGPEPTVGAGARVEMVNPRGRKYGLFGPVVGESRPVGWFPTLWNPDAAHRLAFFCFQLGKMDTPDMRRSRPEVSYENPFRDFGLHVLVPYYIPPALFVEPPPVDEYLALPKTISYRGKSAGMLQSTRPEQCHDRHARVCCVFAHVGSVKCCRRKQWVLQALGSMSNTLVDNFMRGTCRSQRIARRPPGSDARNRLHSLVGLSS